MNVFLKQLVHHLGIAKRRYFFEEYGLLLAGGNNMHNVKSMLFVSNDRGKSTVADTFIVRNNSWFTCYI